MEHLSKVVDLFLKVLNIEKYMYIERIKLLETVKVMKTLKFLISEIK